MNATARGNAADWSRDELILALDVYMRLDGAVPGPKRLEITELSEILRAADLHPAAARRPNFRSPASVVMKLMNFRSIDPDYGGKGLAGSGRLDREIWKEMTTDRPRLAAVAAAIRQALKIPQDVPPIERAEPWIVEAEEGALLTRLHLSRERSERLVKAKKRQVLESTGRLACEACGFCFADAYGEIGEGFTECHHRRPLSSIPSARRTTLDELAVVCANCHRMIHCRRPWLTIEELRTIMASPKADSAEKR